MINNFPSQDGNYTYYQRNRGNSKASGNIWSSMNLDLQSNVGIMRVSPRLITNSTEVTDSNLGLPVNFVAFKNEIWTVAGTRVFNSSSPYPSAAFSENTDTGYVTTYTSDSDIATFDGKLWVSNDAGLYTKTTAGGSWTQTTATPTAGILQYFRKTDRLYIIQGSGVESISNAGAYSSSGDYTIDLGSDVFLTSMAETTDSIWIGTINTIQENGRAAIYRWDGVVAQATDIFYSDANEVLSLVVKDDVPFAMDSNGVLSQFTGSTFEEVGRLPFGNIFAKGTATGTSNARYMSAHGMVVDKKNNTILVLIRNIYEDANDTIPENCPSGLWEWSQEFGFVHKYSLSYTPRGTTTITDYGQNRVWAVGGLANVDIGDDSSSRNGNLLVGAEYALDSTTSTPSHFGIFYDDSTNTTQKKGYFVTNWFDSIQIEDKWERLWAIHKRLLDSGDSIVFKYRLYEEEPVYADITWVNTTSFTTTTDVQTSYDPSSTGFNGTVGGEVEFTQGVGSGACVHITNISEAGGTYTVTIDTAVTGATTTTAKARFQKWIKLNPTISGQIKSYDSMAIGENNTRIQIKGCLTFLGDDEFIKMALVSNEDIQITK